MGWEALVIKFLFAGLDYLSLVLTREPERQQEANEFITRIKAMIADERPPNAGDHAFLDSIHAQLDARIDKVIKDDEAG